MGSAGYAVRTVVCGGCGKVETGRFPPDRRYCSQACAGPARAQGRRNGQEVPCHQCAKPIYRVPSMLKPRNFCSKVCADEFQSRDKTVHTCETCGSEFRWSPSRAKSNNIRYCSIPCRDADPLKKDQLRTMNNMQQKLKLTNCERLGYAMLDSLHLSFVRQHMVDGKFCVDAYLPNQNVVVQFDGDYWHGNPAKYPALDKRQQKRVQYDRSQDAFMTSNGMRVFRFWHSELQSDSDGISQRLRRLLALP